MIEVKGLTYAYTEKDVAVTDVSFDVKDHEWLSIIGHNGSGKSTIAKLLVGLLAPTSGTISYDGVVLNEVCKKIESVAKENGYGVFDVLTGHGVGSDLHEDPFIPNLANHESEGIILKEGMTLAIEPMFSLGTKEVWLMPDEWGIVTRDGSYTAHFEHTILVTKDGYEILTGE